MNLFICWFGDSATKQANITNIPLTQIKNKRNAIHEDSVSPQIIARDRAINRTKTPIVIGFIAIISIMEVNIDTDRSIIVKVIYKYEDEFILQMSKICVHLTLIL